MGTTVKKIRGFTIVELLVVITVLGILAGITIVAFGAWQKRSAQNVVQSDLRGVAAAMENARNFSSGYPLTIPSTIQASQNVSLSYVRGSATDYCVSGTSTKTSGVTYYIEPSVSKDPQAGSCPSIVTNLITNPSLERGSTSPNWGYYSSPLSVDTTFASHGSASLKTITNSTTNPQGIVFAGQGVPAGTYTCSVDIAGTPGYTVAVAGRTEGPYAEGMGGKSVNLTTSFQRVSVTFTLGAAVGTLEVQAHLSAPASGVTIWEDGAMCTSGSTAYGYGDGDSSGWSWNGTAGSSTSTGPGV